MRNPIVSVLQDGKVVEVPNPYVKGFCDEPEHQPSNYHYAYEWCLNKKSFIKYKMNCFSIVQVVKLMAAKKW